MAPSENPRKHARDIADGYVLLSPVLLRTYGVDGLRTLKQALELELRDVRAAVVSAEALLEIQARQRRILRLHQALQVLRAFASKRRLAV